MRYVCHGRRRKARQSTEGKEKLKQGKVRKVKKGNAKVKNKVMKLSYE